MNTSKIICSKENIVLTRHILSDLSDTSDLTNNFHFDIQFNIFNKNNLNMKNIINSKLFNLIRVINQDIIDKSEIINNISEQEIDVLYIFKRFGGDFGISKKYCFLKTIIEYHEDQILIKCKSIPYLGTINASPIFCDETTFSATNLNNSNVTIEYDFKVGIEEELPIYMENILGILMKKVFNNFKLFIEN